MWSQSYGNECEQTVLERLMVKGGGLYRSSGKNSITFNVYTGVQYVQLSTRSQGPVIELDIQCPPGPSRDPESRKRVDHRKHVGSEKLTSDSFIALALVSRGSFKAYLANLVSSKAMIKIAPQTRCRFTRSFPNLLPSARLSFSQNVAPFLWSLSRLSTLTLRVPSHQSAISGSQPPSTSS